MSDAAPEEAEEGPWSPLSATFYAMRLMIARALKLAGETPQSFHTERLRLIQQFADQAGSMADDASREAFDQVLAYIEEAID